MAQAHEQAHAMPMRTVSESAISSPADKECWLFWSLSGDIEGIGLARSHDGEEEDINDDGEQNP